MTDIIQLPGRCLPFRGFLFHVAAWELKMGTMFVKSEVNHCSILSYTLEHIFLSNTMSCCFGQMSRHAMVFLLEHCSFCLTFAIHYWIAIFLLNCQIFSAILGRITPLCPLKSVGSIQIPFLHVKKEGDAIFDCLKGLWWESCTYKYHVWWDL